MKRKELILETALGMFNERGVSDVGVREIARAMDISVGNLSYHFPKKEDIIVALLGKLSEYNSATYDDFFDGPPSLQTFLDLMERVFHNQFTYRGMLIANPEMKKITKNFYDYDTVVRRRMETIYRIFDLLTEAGHLELSPAEREHLGSFMSLFARFWIHEAFIDNKELDKQILIPKYIAMLKMQLELFATEKGKAALNQVEVQEG